MDRTEYLAKRESALAAVEARQGDLERASRALADANVVVNRLDNKALHALTDDDILASAELRAWLLTLTTQGAYARRRKLFARLDLVDSEGETAEGWPVPRVRLSREFRAFGPVVAQLIEFRELWGDPDADAAYVDVSTRDLSEGGSYSILWRDMDDATVTRLRWGSKTEVFTGSLLDSLKWVDENTPGYPSNEPY